MITVRNKKKMADKHGGQIKRLKRRNNLNSFAY